MHTKLDLVMIVNEVEHLNARVKSGQMKVAKMEMVFNNLQNLCSTLSHHRQTVISQQIMINNVFSGSEVRSIEQTHKSEIDMLYAQYTKSLKETLDTLQECIANQKAQLFQMDAEKSALLRKKNIIERDVRL